MASEIRRVGTLMILLGASVTPAAGQELLIQVEAESGALLAGRDNPIQVQVTPKTNDLMRPNTGSNGWKNSLAPSMNSPAGTKPPR